MMWIYLKAFMSLFVVVDPIGNIPLFLTAAGSLEDMQRRRAFSISVLVAFCILLVFSVLGKYILNDLFRINLADVRMAGGLLLLIISIRHLLNSKNSVTSTGADCQTAEEIGCVPMACPLLAGPGAMVTSLTIWHDPQQGPMAAMVGIVMVLGLFWAMMRIVDTINRVVGKLIITAISKVMLVFLAAFGINMIVQGILAYFPCGSA